MNEPIELLVGEEILIMTPNGYIRIETSARWETADSKTMIGRTTVSIIAYQYYPQNRLIQHPSASIPDVQHDIEIAEVTHD